MRKLLFCLMLFVGITVWAADNLLNDISPWEYWRQGFEAFEQGEQLYNAKKYDKAMVKYLNAKRAFLHVKQAKPNWKQDVIMQRVRLCDEKIILLEQRQSMLKHPDNNNRYNSDPTTSYKKQYDTGNIDNRFTFTSERRRTKSTATSSDSREIRQLKKQLKDYREKLFSTLVTLEDYRNKDKRSNSALAEIESLIKEKSVLNSKYQLLMEKYNTLQQQRMPRNNQDSLNNQLVEEKMRSDLLSQKIKMYQSNIKTLQGDIITAQKNNRNDKFSVRKSAARVTALEDEIKRLTRNASTYKGQTKKVSVELEKQQYINGIEQRKTKHYEAQLAKLNKWLNNSDKSKATAINKNIAQENIEITQQLSKLQDKNDTLLRESLKLKSKLTAEHINITKLKDMLSSIETEKLELKYRLKKSATRAQKRSGTSTIQTDEITKLRQENRQLKEDLNLFGKSYSKRSSTSNTGTLSQYKLIVDKLNAELATVKASSQQYKLTRKSQQQQIMKLLDENSKLKDSALDLVEENKNLKTFVKDYDTVTKANDKLKSTLSKGAITNNKLNKLKQERIKLLKRNKTLSDKLASYNKTTIVIPVKPPTVKKNSMVTPAKPPTVKKNSKEHSKLQQEIVQLRQKNSAITAKLAKKNTEVTQLKTMLKSSRKDVEKYQIKLKQRIQQAVKIKKTTPQILPEKLGSQQIAFLLQEGIRAEKNNDYEAAAWHYRKIILNIPEHPEANRRLGLINLNRGNYRKSTQQLEKALRAAPKDIELLLAFAAALSNNDKGSVALKIVKQATKLAPKNSRVYIINGTILKQLKQPNAAEASFRRAVTLAPDSAEANLKLAQMLVVNKKDLKLANNCYRKALKLGAAHDPMLDKKFSIKKATDSEAIAALQQMVAEHEAKKDYVAAAWCYAQLLERDKNNSELKLKYGTTLLLDGKLKQSLPLLIAAEGKVKDKLSAQLLLAANYRLLGKTSQADKNYQQALILLKSTPKYRQTAAVKQINMTIKKKFGTKAGKEFKQITAKLK